MSIIASTFKEFLENYGKDLEYHKTEYEDNCELTFIGEKQHLYSLIIEIYESSMLYDNSHLSKEQKDTIKQAKEMIDELIIFESKNTVPDILLWERLQVSSYKIMEFLKQRKQELEKDLNPTPEKLEHEPLDLSNTSAVEKIIYLNELGIIDFLRTKPEFMGSTNLMATFLSDITDVKVTTLQSSLNRLINEDTEDKNHPYKAKGTANKIRQTFIDKNIKPKTS
jgi:hypothetical protein